MSLCHWVCALRTRQVDAEAWYRGLQHEESPGKNLTRTVQGTSPWLELRCKDVDHVRKVDKEDLQLVVAWAAHCLRCSFLGMAVDVGVCYAFQLLCEASWRT